VTDSLIKKRNILFICSKNQWRSPTAETIWRKHPSLNVKSAGTSTKARRTVSSTDITWAIAHFCLGLFLPFLIYAAGGMKVLFLIGLTITAFFHYGYEFWEDQLTRSHYSPDWDQIATGTLGLILATIIFYFWEKFANSRFRAEALI
jgi:hypothetical protein